jgi:hypothetical protein
VQVADRWHLLNNLVDTLLRSLERNRGTVREVRDSLEASFGTQLICSTDLEDRIRSHRREQRRRGARLELYQQMTEQIARGKSQAEAAASVGISFRTVQRWITTEFFRSASTGCSQATSMHSAPISKSVLRKAAPTSLNSGVRSGSRASEEMDRAYGTGCAAASNICKHPERHHP